ncbi:DUF362 domain-containing protein [Bryobacter aggregatus]|uniref:DUF362 domain-containing protein n=1 Tax=Bryobacter aggregatus TaxID=360054 RepID=UPI0004E153F3|nr:DUF362 domain-containing protein [Bryobacter aggregatus]
MPLDLDSPVLVRRQLAYPTAENDRLLPGHPGVASLLETAGLDARNPFAPWIRPGMRVLIKPNWVRHANDEWALLEALTTHTSIVRPVVEFVAAALQNRSGAYEGEIILADAPLQSANFELLLEQLSILPLYSHWRSMGLPVSLADLRRVIADTDESTGVVRKTSDAAGDPRGDSLVDLKQESRLDALLHDGNRVGVSNYDCETTTQHHTPGTHRYRIANSLLEADVVINLPKWKTHVKTGITGALKNFIGVNCDKAYLPHFRVGSPRKGGDEYPDSFTGEYLVRLRPWVERVVPKGLLRRARKSLLASAQRSGSPLVFGGAWPGNDTLWRTVHDMVFIARWLGQGGAKLSSPRPILTLLDAIVAGDGDGPLRPETRPMRCLLFGTDPGQIDIHACALSGFDWKRIPLLARLADPEASSITRFHPSLAVPATELQLRPPLSWATTLLMQEARHDAA